MSRYLKIIAKITGIIIGICILLWVGLMVFVNYNKETFAKLITNKINDRINGTLSIEKIDLTIIRSFPDISFELKNVTLKDSLYSIHHTELMNMGNIYVSISLSSVLKKQAFIEQVTIENGNISMFTDENGVSNTRVFKPKEQKGETDNDNPVNDVVIKNVILSIKNLQKKKDFVLALDKCDFSITHNDTGWVAYMKSAIQLQSFSFNTDKGSFMKGKTLAADIELQFNKSKMELTLPLQTLTLDDAPYQLGGTFYFADTPYHFNLDVGGTQVAYSEVLGILTPSISKKLTDISVKTVDNIALKIIGKMKYRDTPYVKAEFEVKNTTLNIPQGEITQCSFKGFFLDERVQGKGHGDANSMVNVESLTGNYYGIPFKAENSTVTDLKNPLLKTTLSSAFALPQLNNLIGTSSFRFTKGKANLRLDCKLELNADSRYPPDINGKLSFNNTDFTYTPRNLDFKQAQGDIVFNHSDVAIHNLSLVSGPNKVTVNGSINNLLNLYYTAPEKVVIDCDISSKKIDLDEYITFLGQRTLVTVPSKSKTSASVQKFARQLDAIMDESSVNIALNIEQLDYKKFRSEKIKADVILKKSEIILRNANLHHAGGTLLVNANIRPEKQSNKFTAEAKLKDVDVRKLFYAFGNFGQTAIIDSNIEGNISADITAMGGIKYSGDIVPHSLNGKVDFSLREGRLIDFEPLGTIGKIIFFNRDLSYIKVEPLNGTLDVNNSNITIQPMLIQTSAFNIFTEGVYGIPTGTDILVQIPLRNPKKDLNKNNQEMAETDLKKGIVINLRATDNNTGKVKIKLGKGKKK